MPVNTRAQAQQAQQAYNDSAIRDDESHGFSFDEGTEEEAQTMLPGLFSSGESAVRWVDQQLSSHSPVWARPPLPHPTTRTLRQRGSSLLPTLDYDGGLLRAINTRSSEDLVLHQLSVRALRQGNALRDEGNTIFKHAHTSGPSSNQSLSAHMTSFLSERRAAGGLHNEHEKRKSSTRKRTFREVIGEPTSNPFEQYRFESIRPSSCIFLNPGAEFNGEDIFKLHVLRVETKENHVSGFIQFEDSSALRYWLKAYTTRSKYSIKDDQFIVDFTGQVVDFEENDLRFETRSYDNTDTALGYEHLIDVGRSKESHTALQSCMLWWQLDKWQMLTPFKGLSRDSLQRIMTCPECLSLLQRSFVLLKLCLAGSRYPDMLCSVNRSNGEMELVATDERLKAINLADFGRCLAHAGQSSRPVAKLNSCSSRHSSQSVKIS